MAVAMYAGTDKAFKDACDKAEIPPTRRQYKKWQRRVGKAWETHCQSREAA